MNTLLFRLKHYIKIHKERNYINGILHGFVRRDSAMFKRIDLVRKNINVFSIRKADYKKYIVFEFDNMNLKIYYNQNKSVKSYTVEIESENRYYTTYKLDVTTRQYEKTVVTEKFISKKKFNKFLSTIPQLKYE